MIRTVNVKAIVVEIIVLLYILLFVYAAVSKLLDFENFQVQMGQSPLISSFAGFLSYFVPLVEIVLAFSMGFFKTRLFGLYLSYVLMSLFSAYIYVMLTFSPFVPCSCGGVLQDLKWQEHLYFNLLFVILGGIAILLNRSSMKRKTIGILFLLFIFSSLFIYVLFQLSDQMHHQRNHFTRNFPHHPVAPVHEIDLGLNSYYIAGSDDRYVYLGNYTAPLLVTEIDKKLQQKKEYLIKLPKSSQHYQSLTLSVDAPYYYIWDGRAGLVYGGRIGLDHARLLFSKDAFFTSFVAISPFHASIRSISSAKNETVLGTLSYHDSVKVVLHPEVLIKQVDGLFDTDGTHIYNKQHHKIIYTYYYRNQYIVADSLMKHVQFGNTIDTTTQAAIQVTYIPSLKGSKMSTPAVTVNKRTATFGSYLYVHAGLLGLYEDKDNWRYNTVIDVYDYTKNTYQFSFYIDDHLKNKVKDFRVHRNLIYILQGNYIRTYQFKEGFYEKAQKNTAVSGEDRKPEKE